MLPPTAYELCVPIKVTAEYSLEQREGDELQVVAAKERGRAARRGRKGNIVDDFAVRIYGKIRSRALFEVIEVSRESKANEE